MNFLSVPNRCTPLGVPLRTLEGCTDNSQGLSECNERNPWFRSSNLENAPLKGARSLSQFPSISLREGLIVQGSVKLTVAVVVTGIVWPFRTKGL